MEAFPSFGATRISYRGLGISAPELSDLALLARLSGFVTTAGDLVTDILLDCGEVEAELGQRVADRAAGVQQPEKDGAPGELSVLVSVFGVSVPYGH